MKRIVALVVAMSLSGCSFAMVKAPTTTEPEPTTWPVCTDHYFWALVDGSITALAATGVAFFLNKDDEWAPIVAGFEGALALGFGISAVTGLGKTSRCRTARAAYEKAAAEGR